MEWEGRRPGGHPALNQARRDALLALTAVAGVPLLPGCGTTQPVSSACAPLPSRPVLPTGRAQIDVHCHVFNVRDIPAYAFVEDVFIENEFLRVIAAPAAQLLVRIAAGFAPDYEKEKRALEALASGAPTVEGHSDEEIFAAGFTTFVRFDTSFFAVERNLESPPQDTLENDRFARRLYQLYVPTFDQGMEAMALGAALIEAANVRRLFDAMKAVAAKRPAGTDAPSYIAQFFTYWGMRLARHRFHLASELATQLPAGAPRLLTPATLDLTHWLPTARVDPTPVTTLRQQVELMHLIALHSSNALVHGFIAFDPWRYLEDLATGTHPNALEVVRAAITEHGFIGVKLYPPMGFRAADNAGRPCSDFPEALADLCDEPGQALDDVLDELYKFCEAEDVPIMAHCAASIGTSTQNALCAAPSFWLKVLRKRKALRLNLAHFGAVWNLYATEQCPDKAEHALWSDGVSWTRDVVEMIKDAEAFPNLYTDFGDFSPVLGRTADECQQLEKILCALESLIGDSDRVKSRIMYGTDWLMLGREPGFEDYYADFRARMVERLKLSPDDLYWRNAARYLGLTRNGNVEGATLSRLRQFYQANQRNPAVLEPFVVS